MPWLLKSLNGSNNFIENIFLISDRNKITLSDIFVKDLLISDKCFLIRNDISTFGGVEI